MATQMTRQQARAAGATRYFGKVCARHPELKGARLPSNGLCPACFREKKRRRLKQRLENAPRYPWVITLEGTKDAITSLVAQLRSRANLKAVRVKRAK
jgi:hypothetical protein